MVAAAAAVIFTGSGVGASSVQTTPAQITAIGPFGQAVANQKAAEIITANAARIPVRTAVRGSDQRGAVGMGFDTVSPLARAAERASSRSRARVKAHAAAARRSADNVSGPSCGARLAFVIELSEFGESSRSGPRCAATASAIAQRSTAACTASRNGESMRRASTLSKNADERMVSSAPKSLASASLSEASCSGLVRGIYCEFCKVVHAMKQLTGERGELRRKLKRENQTAHQPHATDPECDLGGPTDDERISRICVQCCRDADDCRRVASQLKAVRKEIAFCPRCEGAHSDPSGKRCDEELAVLGKPKHQRSRHQDSHGRAAEAVESFGEDEAAIGLSHDKDREKRPIGFIERKPERDEEGDESRRKRLPAKNGDGEIQTARGRHGAFCYVRLSVPEAAPSLQPSRTRLARQGSWAGLGQRSAEVRR